MPKKEGHEAKFIEVMAILPLRESLRESCREVKCDATGFLNWVNDDDSRKLQYARAREEMLAYVAAKTIELADEPPPLIGADQKVDPGWVQWQKNRIEARRWHLGKIAPKKYGDKLELSGDVENPIAVATLDVSKLSTSALAELMAAKNAAK